MRQGGEVPIFLFDYREFSHLKLWGKIATTFNNYKNKCCLKDAIPVCWFGRLF